MASGKSRGDKKKETVSNSGSGIWLRWLPWLPAVLGFALYLNTLGHDYALDDAIVITENMFTEQGVEGIPGLLKYDTFYGFFKVEGKARLVAGGRYRPLTPVMFAVERSIFGDSPFMGHLINGLLYGLLCTLLFFTLQRLLRVRFGEESARSVAFLAAILFAAHPLHTEAVANIKGRDEIVTLLGSLAAWWAVLRHTDDRKPWALPLAAVSLFLALMSKEHAIAFLAVIPASLWFFRPEQRPAGLLRLWPLALAAGAFLLIRGSVIGWSMGHEPLEMLNNPFVKPGSSGYVPFSAGERWGTILFTLLLYLKLLVWPWPLTHDYYPRHIAIHEMSDPASLLGLLLYLGLAAMVVLGWRKRTVWSFSAFFYLATLFLMSNILFPVGTTMSERFLFMPSVGFALALAWAAERGVGAAWRKPLRYALFGTAAVWSLLTLMRNPVWKDNYTLFLTDVETSVNSAKLQNAAGGELIAQALKAKDEAQRQKMLREATGHLEKALAIHPAYKNACLLLGNACNYLKEYESSIAWYGKALELDPAYAEARNNLQITLREAGRYAGESKGDLRGALQYLGRALEMKPSDFETLRLMGIAYGLGGKHDEAIRHFGLALEQQPANAEIMAYLGNAWMHAGDSAQARSWHRKANETEPGILKKLGIPES